MSESPVPSSQSRRLALKIIMGVTMVVPVSVVALGMALVALYWGGRGLSEREWSAESAASGAFAFVLAAVGCWCLYGLVMSFFGRHSASITAGMSVGLIILSVCVYHAALDAMAPINSPNARTSGDYLQVFGYGYAFFSGWIMTACLLWRAFSEDPWKSKWHDHSHPTTMPKVRRQRPVPQAWKRPPSPATINQPTTAP